LDFLDGFRKTQVSDFMNIRLWEPNCFIPKDGR